MTKYRFIYKITCLCGDWKGKFYIGQHTTDNLDDGYAGSGIKIREYYSIYGKKLNVTYKIKILKDKINNQKTLDKWERYYISKYLGTDNCLNIDEGGSHRKNDKLRFHTVELLADGSYRSCDNIISEDIKKTKFDKETTNIINELKKDPYNIELRLEAIKHLIRYNTTPSLLNIL